MTAMGMRTRRIATIGGIGLALGLVTVLALGLAFDRKPVSPRAGTGPAVSGPPGPAPSGASPLHLVAGSRWINGVYTDYPRSRAGAVSAAVEFISQLGSTLDPDRAASVARLVASPSYQAAGQDAAASAVAARRALGLQASGLLPASTEVFLVPVMYQLRGSFAVGRLTVLLLFDYTLTASSGVTEHTGVTQVRLTWTPASWRLLAPPATDLAALLAPPGTASAAAKGWEAMT
jgi:hypothetical protein